MIGTLMSVEGEVSWTGSLLLALGIPALVALNGLFVAVEFALVAVRKLTGRVAPSCKFADAEQEAVQRTLDDAERRFEAERDRIVPVTVI